MKKLAMICGIALIGASVSAFAGKFENNTAVVHVKGDTMLINPVVTAEGKAVIANPKVKVGGHSNTNTITIECGNSDDCGNDNIAVVDVEGDTIQIGPGNVNSVVYE